MQQINEKYFRLLNRDVIYTENKEGLACPCHICKDGILVLEGVDTPNNNVILYDEVHCDYCGYKNKAYFYFRQHHKNAFCLYQNDLRNVWVSSAL